MEVFALLADIRFKLLAFVPSIVGATVALVSKEHDQRVIVAVSALGFMATLGILLYELRNSELYNAAVYRARVLEGELGLTGAVARRSDQSTPRPQSVEQAVKRTAALCAELQSGSLGRGTGESACSEAVRRAAGEGTGSASTVFAIAIRWGSPRGRQARTSATRST